MTNTPKLLENNNNLSLGQIMAEIHYQNSLMCAMHDADLTVADLAAINLLLDTYGVSYRGASMVRQYLEGR